MTVAAVSMFRNEEDLAAPVVRHMLAECDRVVVADNGSTDGTAAALAAIGDPRLLVVDEPRFAYRQAETMNALAALVAEEGAAWVVPFDADEWWEAPAGRRVADALGALPADVIVAAAAVYDMVTQPGDDPALDPFARTLWWRPGSYWSPFPKVAYRPGPGRVLLQGNHGLAGVPTPPVGPLRVRHYPFRSLEQARAKLRHGRAAVEAADLPAGSGAHWREWGAYSDAALADWWARWTDPAGLVRWREP